MQPTSARAYQAADLPAGQRKIHAALELRNMTDHEIVAETGMLLQSVCGARNKLIKLGLVEATSQTRPGPYGHDCVIWRLKCNDPERAGIDLRVEDPDQHRLGL